MLRRLPSVSLNSDGIFSLIIALGGVMRVAEIEGYYWI